MDLARFLATHKEVHPAVNESVLDYILESHRRVGPDGPHAIADLRRGRIRVETVAPQCGEQVEKDRGQSKEAQQQVGVTRRCTDLENTSGDVPREISSQITHP